MLRLKVKFELKKYFIGIKSRTTITRIEVNFYSKIKKTKSEFTLATQSRVLCTDRNNSGLNGKMTIGIEYRSNRALIEPLVYNYVY